MLLWLILNSLLISSAADAAPARTPHVMAELLSEQRSLRPGEEAWIGVRLEIIPQWHTYWAFPGDSGLPTTAKWSLPAGWTVSDPHWEIPHRILVLPLVNYGYEKETFMGFRLRVPAGQPPGKTEIAARVSWLVCKEECIPEKADLKLIVDVAPAPPKKNPWSRLFDRLRAEQPAPLPQGETVSLQANGENFNLVLSERSSWLTGALDFFPLDAEVVRGDSPPLVTNAGMSRQLHLRKAEPFAASLAVFRGVLVVDKRRAYKIELPLPTAEAPAVNWMLADLLLVVFAFLGGLLLNLMPCVFPVLSLKALSLLKSAKQSTNQTRHQGEFYTLGVLVSFWVLTALLLSLRHAGQAVGWGFQLQQPAFVIALVLLFSFLAASLFGFFEIGGRWMGVGSSLADKDGYAGSFFTGVLAVVVATPCTAPFMGGAISVALTQPAWLVFIVFSSLALGLASPFLLISWRPQLLRFLPKPGAWMERLKQIFALPMLVTVAWLLWVLDQQIGTSGTVLIAAAAILAVASAIFWSRSRITGTLFLAGALVATIAGATRQPDVTEVHKEGGWQPYSATTLRAALDEGKPVFIDFTAAWCLTCQVNKKVVLERAPVKEFFRDKGVVLLRADWTNQDAEVTRALESYGRIGVPVYVAYRKGVSLPNVLPQILSENLVKEAFPD